jgi:hypothetical protein
MERRYRFVCVPLNNGKNGVGTKQTILNFILMKKKHYLIIACIGLLTAATFSACDKDKDGEGEVNIEEGKFAGTTWVRKESINSIVTRREYTYTVSFTSATKGAYKVNGWFQVYDHASKKWPAKTTENDTDEFTYVYSPELGSGATQGGISAIFSFPNESTLKFSGMTYERQ